MFVALPLWETLLGLEKNLLVFLGAAQVASNAAEPPQDAEMPPRAAAVNGGAPGGVGSWGKSGIISVHQDAEEIPVCDKLALIESFREEVMDQRKKAGCCKSVGLGMMHPRALRWIKCGRAAGVTVKGRTLPPHGELLRQEPKRPKGTARYSRGSFAVRFLSRNQT